METVVKKRPKRFNELTKQEKAFRIFNVCFNIVEFVFMIGLLIYYLIIKDPNNRFWACIGTLFFLVIPPIIELIFKTRLSNIVYLIFLMYVLVASVWGASLNAYNNIIWLDKVVHFGFGYVGAVAGLFAICTFEDYSKLKNGTIIFICFMVSMACGAIWEIMEFCSDQFLGQTAQGIPDANGVVSVMDTMLDICCNFGGAIVFVVHYLIHVLTKKNVGIMSMKKEFSFNPLLKPVEIQVKTKKVKENNNTENNDKVEQEEQDDNIKE